MFKITITGSNYEGAHFRGFPSDTDNTPLRITISAKDESTICDWVLEEFSYGARDEIETLDDLVLGYEAGIISNGDGCGYVGQIMFGDEVVFQDHYFDEDFPVEEILTLKDVNVDIPMDLNTMVAEQKK